jgi:hypothetical protein
MPIKDHLNTREAAEYLGVSYHTLKKSRYTGQLCGLPAPRYRRLGSRLVIYDGVDLTIWLNQVPTFVPSERLSGGGGSNKVGRRKRRLEDS